ncbi:di-trans,poly-cis-decaprenylcistransferase [bacterium CG_4_10_14_0_2_um_filter_33_32]|nr:MAG: di-trans,poly-cis-decaprenylcistransferase [bacterium CG2_30_33_46]PIR67199.1 MAG: di-trans,poly-cis-decaprenylcistransferase [bacterium CG10_big_fil_rev_8_21_14_0_10_33_18]PIW81232.1 MAG: di-trans,poly-cis-decaprenylcistransferase [bacterium CG_4_8_14_3_um_filter_33_28]PIY85609.1 MAG: di-trans,poly-cis-decaprenylcistransferase [bacterium CG_4_10_14_0_8_um_filter_33_57]PIZ86023.1 MAG: di-trans,poly-cis-decaprenylcistransferase [bacterium CG_4_10_14_0_2_um_filter_33_32]PJA72420.1 MAG: d
MKKRIPKHIAIIMDGNRRWAKKKGLIFYKGHQEGVKTFKKIVKYCSKIGVKYLTVYAFSTENKLRAKAEVSALFRILEDALEKEVPELNDNNVKIRFIGNIKGLPKSLQERVKKSEDALSKNIGLMLSVALNYGGREEIIHAAKLSKIINEKNIGNNLYTKGLPSPDLLIRTGGEMRISNFLLWQSAYAELYFTDQLWPDFNEKDLTQAILDYNNRERRFGR